VLTFAAVLALFEVTGAAGAYINQSFLEVVGALPRPAGFEIWQDLPTAFASRLARPPDAHPKPQPPF
jgi:hypothetical protein